MNRIDERLKDTGSERRGALICYLMAGVPDDDRFLDYSLACIEGGADMIEIGIPYSDPIADGKVIQDAAVNALESGVTPTKVLELVRKMRGLTDIPLILMGYYNPIFRKGEEAFVKDCIDAGADGLIVPDLPLHEGKGLGSCCRKHGLALIQLTTPLTKDARNIDLMDATEGFLYMVTRMGVTGKGGRIADELPRMVSRCRKHDPGVRLAAGFGISCPDDVRRVISTGADAAIVGSALVSMTLNGDSPDAMREKVSSLAKACREG